MTKAGKLWKTALESLLQTRGCGYAYWDAGINNSHKALVLCVDSLPQSLPTERQFANMSFQTGQAMRSHFSGCAGHYKAYAHYGPTSVRHDPCPWQILTHRILGNLPAPTIFQGKHLLARP